MNRFKLIGLAAFVVAVVPAMVWGEEPEVPDVPDTPAAIEQLVYARPFTLTEGYKHEWRKERPLVKQGYVLVMKVDPDLVYPRQVAEPVLYAGDQTAERVNVGYESGHVVAIVPGKLDLKKSPIWFGTPELPEGCTAETIKEERRLADEAGIKPAAEAQVSAAQAKGGKRLKVADRYALGRELAGLIKRYAPDETDLIARLLVPREE
jgi:hypothetical protein